MEETIFSELDIPSGKVNKFMALTNIRTYPQGGCFIWAGTTPSKIGLVQKGLFRYLYTDQAGNGFTKSFMPERNFISSYSAMVQKRPSYFSIEALEDSTVLEIKYENWLLLREGHRCWDRLLLGILEKGFMAKEKRERELLLLDAETRYRNFLLEYPALEKRVKQHLIASYLGIKPESLSRIRKNLHGIT